MGIKRFSEFSNGELEGITKEDISGLKDIFEDITDSESVTKVSVKYVDGNIDDVLEIVIGLDLMDKRLALNYLRQNPRMYYLNRVMLKNLVRVTISGRGIFPRKVLRQEFNDGNRNFNKSNKIHEITQDRISRVEKYLNLSVAGTSVWFPGHGNFGHSIYFIKDLERIREIFHNAVSKFNLKNESTSYDDYSLEGITEEDISNLEDVFNGVEDSDIVKNVEVGKLKNESSLVSATLNMDLGFPRMYLVPGFDDDILPNSLVKMLRDSIVIVAIRGIGSLFDKTLRSEIFKLSQEKIKRAERYLGLSCIYDDISATGNNKFGHFIYFAKNKEKIEEIFQREFKKLNLQKESVSYDDSEGITQEDKDDLQEIFSHLDDLDFVTNVRIDPVRNYMQIGKITSNLNLSDFSKNDYFKLGYGIHPCIRNVCEFLSKNLVLVSIVFDSQSVEKTRKLFPDLVLRAEKYLNMVKIYASYHSSGLDKIVQQIYFLKDKENTVKMAQSILLKKESINWTDTSLGGITSEDISNVEEVFNDLMDSRETIISIKVTSGVEDSRSLNMFVYNSKINLPGFNEVAGGGYKGTALIDNYYRFCDIITDNMISVLVESSVMQSTTLVETNAFYSPIKRISKYNLSFMGFNRTVSGRDSHILELIFLKNKEEIENICSKTKFLA